MLEQIMQAIKNHLLDIIVMLIVQPLVLISFLKTLKNLSFYEIRQRFVIALIITSGCIGILWGILGSSRYQCNEKIALSLPHGFFTAVWIIITIYLFVKLMKKIDIKTEISKPAR